MLSFPSLFRRSCSYGPGRYKNDLSWATAPELWTLYAIFTPVSLAMGTGYRCDCAKDLEIRRAR